MVITEELIWSHLQEIADPEIPVLTIVEMGIVRGVEEIDKNGEVHYNIIITPTYNGCPAMDIISTQIRLTLLGYDIRNFSIVQKLSPAWTTDWITAEAREKMRRFGIAPPRLVLDASGNRVEQAECPRCGSRHVHKVSEFSSTACKSLFTCEDCQEPFEYFKCH